MSWYYAIGEERKGPVSEEDFQRLAPQGIVASKTLIWRDGLAKYRTSIVVWILVSLVLLIIAFGIVAAVLSGRR